MEISSVCRMASIADFFREQLSQVNGVTSSAYASHMYFNLFIKTSSLSKEFQNYNTKMAIEQQGQDATPEYVDLGCMLVFLQDQEFRTYLKELGLTEDAHGAFI